MKNSGFTLVELLAVILILSLLTVLATTSVTKIVKDSKNRLYKAQIESIKASAESWASENLSLLPQSGECAYLTLKNLKTYGVVDDDVKDPRTNSLLSDDMKIKITAKSSSVGKSLFDYEVGATNVSTCSKISLTIGKIVYFDVENGKSCSDYVKENSESGYNGIDNKGENKTSCLKFYKFPNSSEDVVTLILDHNTTSESLAADPSTDTNKNGPLEALKTLKNDTQNWKETLTPSNYSYNSGSISYTINYTGYKARLITANEVAQIAGIDFDETTQEGLSIKVPLISNSFSTSEVNKKLYILCDDVSSFDCEYITSSAIQNTYGSFWIVRGRHLGYGTIKHINSSGVTENKTYGIRPVIEVNSSVFSE